MEGIISTFGGYKMYKRSNGKYFIICIIAGFLVMSGFGTININIQAGFIPGVVENIDSTVTFSSIQDAIDDAGTLDGHTIHVGSGIYEESIYIDKSISLIGEDKDNTIINGTTMSHAVWIFSDYVNFSGFTVKNLSGSFSHSRIYVTGSNSSIENCTIISKGTRGIYVENSYNNFINNSYINILSTGEGIHNYYSDNTTISNCYIESMSSYNNGIEVWESNNNTFNNNTFNNSELRLGFSENNTVTNNTFLNNASFNNYRSNFNNFSNNNFESNSAYELYTKDGCASIGDSKNITIVDNFVNEKPLVYLEDKSYYSITLAGQVLLINCNNITVENQNLSNTIKGIWLDNTIDSKFKNNTIKNNRFGIESRRSHNNTFENNTIKSKEDGFLIRQSDNNSIKNNSINADYNGIYFQSICYNNIVEYNDIKGSRGGLSGSDSYYIYYKIGDNWKEIKTLHLSKFYEYYMIDVSDLLTNDVDEYIFRIEQKGGITSHIDYISLYNGEYFSPYNAYNIESRDDVSSKIIKKDNDVVNSHNQVFEFKWINKFDETPRFLILNANEELYEIERPITTPRIMESQNMMEYTIKNNGMISIENIDYNLEPDLSDIWHPGSGHPTGKANLWLSSDGKDLFGVLEVTSDNTFDETGWGSLYILKNGEINEFRITSKDDRYGDSYFSYKGTVSWQHMVYEFCIPLEEITSEVKDTILIGFGSYGTMSNEEAGIFIENGNNTVIRFNNISYSNCGIITSSHHFEHIHHNKIFNNSMAGIRFNTTYTGTGFNKNISSNHIFNNSEGILIKGSDFNIIYDNNISNNLGYGINIMDGGNNNTIFNNKMMKNNNCGIVLSLSDYNLVHSNIIKQNMNCGIKILSSDNNTIYNNYFDNTFNAFDDANNTWNISKTFGTNIVNGPYLGGNYWSDYNGVDTDSDGLGDTCIPHNSGGLIVYGGDYHPLIKPVTICSDIFGYYGATSGGESFIQNRIVGSEFTPTTSGTAQYIRAHINVSMIGGDDFPNGNPGEIADVISGQIGDWIRGQKFTFDHGTGNHYVEFIEAFIKVTEGSKTMKAAIYDNATGDLIATSYELVVPVMDWGWVRFYFEETPVLTSGDYVYAVWSEVGDGYAWLRGDYTPSSQQDGRYDSETYDGTFPDPSGFTDINRQYRIYAKIHYFSREPKVKAAIYNGNTNILVASTEEKTVVFSGWKRFDLLSPLTITSGQPYILVAWSDVGVGNVGLRYTSSAGGSGFWFTDTYPDWPVGPLTFGIFSPDRKHGIYCYYTYLCDSTDQYQLTINYNPTDAGSPITSGPYSEGEVVSISTPLYLTKSSGGGRYHFSHWYGEGIDNVCIPSTTVTMGASDKTITANYTIEYRLTMTSNPPSGTTIPPTGTDWCPEGDDVTISASAPPSGPYDTYVWGGWTHTSTGSGGYTGNENPWYVHMYGDIVQTANWIHMYKLTVTAEPPYPIPSGAVGGTFNVTYTSEGTLYTDESHTTNWTRSIDEGTTVTISDPQYIIPGAQFIFKGYDPSNTVVMSEPRNITLVYTELPYSGVTSGGCYFDKDRDESGQQFKLLFTRDIDDIKKYKLTASNPGQFFFNIFNTSNTPGSEIDIDLLIPSPFVTKGAVPIHVYGGVNVDSEGCFSPYDEIASIALEPGTGGTISIEDITVPDSGLVFVKIHLDFGWKKQTGYKMGPNNLADNTNNAYDLQNLESFIFSYEVNDVLQPNSTTIQNINIFKNDPGFFGVVTFDDNPVMVATITIKNSEGETIGSTTTDENGYYFYYYKHKGKQAEYTVTLTSGVVGVPYPEIITLKSNKFAWVAFEITT